MRLERLPLLNFTFDPFSFYNEYSLELNRTSCDVFHETRQKALPGLHSHICQLRVVDQGWRVWLGSWTRLDQRRLHEIRGSVDTRQRLAKECSTGCVTDYLPLPVSHEFVQQAKAARKERA